MPLPKGYQLTQAGQTTSNIQQRAYDPPSREDIDLDKQNYQESEQVFSEWDWQNEAQMGPNGQALPYFATGWKPNGEADFGTGLSGFYKKFVSNVRGAWKTGYDEGLKISGATEWAIKKAQGDEKGEKTIEAMKDDRKPKDQNAAYWTAAAEGTKEIFNQALWGVLDGLAVPAYLAEQAIGTAGHSIDRAMAGEEITQETLSKDWQASRLAYSSFFDASIYAEMNRRIDAGIRPDLAAQEVMIQNPNTLWPELIGQILLDPLNVVTLWGKAGQAVKLEKNAAKTFHEVANPAIAKMLDDPAKIAKLDDAAAYSNVDEMVKVQQDLLTEAERGFDALSNNYKLASMTRDGKVAHVANQSGEILMHVVNNSNPDEALEILQGMVKSADPDPKIAAEGISSMMHFVDPRALFSEAGNNTTVMLAKMYSKHGDTWLKTLDELKGNPVELTKNLLGKLDEVGEEMFPSVTKMLEAEKLVKAGGEISEATKALAQRAAELPEYVKNATRFHDAAQKVVGPINKFFIGAYMGWSPGYAFRNFSNNSLQLLIDYGPGVLLGDVNKMWGKVKNLDFGGAVKALSADDVFADVEKLHGGILQGAFSEGGQAAALFPDARKVGEGTRDTGVKAIIQAAKAKGLKGPVLGASQVAEANAAKRIIAKTYRSTFDKGVKAMTKALTPQLKEAGFSDEIIKKLPTYILNNDGDASKVINALRSDIQSGTIDLFNDISRIDPKHKGFLEGVGKWDEYAETVLQAPTREAATTAAQKIFDDIAQAGDYVYREGRPAVDNYDKALKMFEQAGLPPQRGQLISLRKTESRKAIQAAESILAEADDLGAQLGLSVGTMKKARKINEISGWGADAAKEADRLNDLMVKIWKKDTKAATVNFNQLWMAYPELFPGAPPASLTKDVFMDALFHNYDQVVSKTWAGARDTAIDNVTGYLDDLKAAGAEVPDQWRDVIKTAQEGAQQYDNAMVGRFGELVEDTPMEFGARTSQISQIAAKYGIETASEAGVPMDKRTLATINKYADVNYKSLEDVPISVAEEAFAKKAGKTSNIVSDASKDSDEASKVVDDASKVTDETSKIERDPDLAYFDDAGELFEPTRKRILPPPTEGEAPPISRAIHEQMDDVKNMRAWMMDDITKNYGKKQIVNKASEQAMSLAEKELTQKLAETRLISSRVAQANRDFTLLNYGDKSYWDTALAYLYPFHFWYKGTYKNWLSRVATNPAILAHYSKYKENLGTVHAGMPEWWKYNLNTNDLPGVDVENPLYFNLEATLWPLNGITGTDFNDPSKRVNAWTYGLDYLNKFGPSTWTPLSMVTGLALYAQGEKEAGETWLGRAFPQSATIKAGASLLGIANLETDPIINMISDDGLDKYERRRVQRALAAMEQEALRGDLPYSQEQIQDAAYAKEGEIWDEAIRRAVRGRAPSQISSFLFGVGFKGRTQEDMQIDNFYSDYSKLFTMRPNLSPEEFREGMDSLKTKYDFMDTVLLSSRDEDKRDSGFAFTVLQRIPPGKSSDISEAAGIDPALLDKFYADKGQIENWSAADRQRFMSGVLNIAAVLEIPSDMTRGEWTKAKNAYSTLSTDAKARFGSDILDLVDGYYQAKTVSYDKADAYLESHPEVSEFMNWKSERVMNSPLLSAYYGGASMIENYYRSKQYAEIEKELGGEIFDVIDEYNDLKTFGDPGEANKFYSQNKAKIKKYYKLKDEWSYTINQNVAQLSAHLPEGEGAGIREDVDMTSPGAQQLAGSMGEEYQPTFEDFQAQIPPRIMNLVTDYYRDGDRIPESAQRQLERLASEMGYSNTDDLLQAIGTSLYAQGTP